MGHTETFRYHVEGAGYGRHADVGTRQVLIGDGTAWDSKATQLGYRAAGLRRDHLSLRATLLVPDPALQLPIACTFC